MSENSNPQSTPRFSMSLMHMAAKGKFHTRRPATSDRSQVVGTLTNVGHQGTPPAEKAIESAAHAEGALAASQVDEAALQPDRLNPSRGTMFAAHVKAQELRITASAAKSLTRLFAAISMDPGTGPEVPVEVRTRILNLLVRESHVLADSVAKSIVGEGISVPTFLRAKLLQHAAEFVSEQWQKHGEIDTKGLRDIATAAFEARVGAITQEVVDLFHEAGEFKQATTQEISRARISEAGIRALWGILKEVQRFDLRDYDPETAGSNLDDPRPFSYGKDPHDVARALTKIALEITQENRLDIDDLDTATNWIQNMIGRASTLVRYEYRMLTDRSLRSAFRDDIFSEAAIGQASSLYEDILERVKTRARNGYITVERNAMDAMSATSYTSYLPKKTTPAADSLAVQPDINSAETPHVAEAINKDSSEPEGSEGKNYAQDESTGQKPRFSFASRG